MYVWLLYVWFAFLRVCFAASILYLVIPLCRYSVVSLLSCSFRDVCPYVFISFVFLKFISLFRSFVRSVVISFFRYLCM